MAIAQPLRMSATMILWPPRRRVEHVPRRHDIDHLVDGVSPGNEMWLDELDERVSRLTLMLALLA